MVQNLEELSNTYEYPITASNIDGVIEILEQYLDREYYEDNDSIWTFEEYLVYNIVCLLNLKILKNYLQEHPESKCYFYDSY